MKKNIKKKYFKLFYDYFYNNKLALSTINVVFKIKNSKYVE